MNILKTAALSSVLALGVSQANAYMTFFGEDLHNSASTPLASTPNASAAEAAFLANLTGVGTENFETFANGTGQPLALDFGAAGMATLSGGGGSISQTAPGTTNGNGRYATSGSNYWEVVAGGSNNFVVTMTEDIAAFGFYGIDIGDFGGQLELELSNGDMLTVPNTVGSGGSTDGSVLFFGVIAESGSELFNSVSFLTSTGGGDVFAFDDLTIGSLEQVSVAEPTTLALLAIGLAGVGYSRRKKA